MIAYYLLGTVVLTGTLGYKFIEDWSWADSFFMTIITVSTVGFDTVGGDLSDAGMIFTSMLIISSFGTFAYAISTITSYIVSGDYRRYLKFQRLVKQIGHLSGHTIICGYGRVGKQAARQLEAYGRKLVVIEMNPDEKDKSDDFPIIDGDATSDDVLRLAGIERANSLITALPSDPGNLYVVLSAKSLNPALNIVSRASSYEAIRKLERAGAHKVVMPDTLGGTHMASLVTSPDLMIFLEQLSLLGEGDALLEEVAYMDLEGLRPHTIGDLRKQGMFGCLVVGMRTKKGHFQVNPPDGSVLEPGSKIFVIGTADQINSLNAFLHKNK